MPLEGVTKEDVALVALRDREATQRRWQALISSADMDSFIQDWCLTSEAALVETIEKVNDVVVAKEYHGRGLVQQAKAYTKPSPRPPKRHLRYDCLRKVYRQVAHLRRLGALTACNSRTRTDLWEVIFTGPMQKEILAGIPQYVGLSLHLALAVPTPAVLKILQSYLASALHAAARARRVGIYNNWKTGIRSDMHRGGRRAYRRIRPPRLSQGDHAQVSRG